MFQEKSIEACILSRVKQITSPGWIHETSAWTWCTGKTWGERVEREVGGGIGMGNTCKPMAVSFQCMTKFTTNKKKNKKKKWTWNNRLAQNWEGSMSRVYIVTLFNLYTEYIMPNTRLDQSQAGIKMAGRTINNLRYSNDTTLKAESKED